MKIFSGTSNPELAQKIAKELNRKLSLLDIHIFPDGEKKVRVLEKIVDEDCVVVQSTSNPEDANYMELFFIADALKRSGARSVTAVIPYLGYQRQDHIFRDGEAVSLEVIIETLESTGVSKIITMDLHSIRIPELFNRIPLVHLSALPLFADIIEDDDSVLVSPDMGGIARIKELSNLLSGKPYAVIDKNRNLSTGEVKAVDLSGNVKGKTAIMVDDIISTGKTMVVGSKLLLKKGAKKVLVFATHPVFSDNSKRILENSPIEKVVVCDTINVPPEKKFKKLEIISVAGIIAKNLR